MPWKYVCCSFSRMVVVVVHYLFLLFNAQWPINYRKIFLMLLIDCIYFIRFILCFSLPLSLSATLWLVFFYIIDMTRVLSKVWQPVLQAILSTVFFWWAYLSVSVYLWSFKGVKVFQNQKKKFYLNKMLRRFYTKYYIFYLNKTKINYKCAKIKIHKYSTIFLL